MRSLRELGALAFGELGWGALAFGSLGALAFGSLGESSHVDRVNA